MWISTLSATEVRRAYFEGDLDRVSAIVPPAVWGFLERFRQTADFAELQAEYRYLQDYQAAWANTPYPVVFVTTDAVVIRSGHVLVVRRAAHPGRGKLAMPGGFLNIKETLLASCIREVIEETGLQISDLAAYQRSQAVFDYPGRSLRGRTVTHAFQFDLGIGQLPLLRPGSDAADAVWLPLERGARHAGAVL